MRAAWLCPSILMAAGAVAEAGAADTADPSGGKVLFGQERLSPEEVARWVAADPLLRRYRATRPEYPDTAAGHVELAAWCGRAGLHQERRAHLLVAERLSPADPEIQRALGRSWRHYPREVLPHWAQRRLNIGMWMTDAEFSDFMRQVGAYRAWKRKLLELRREWIGDELERDTVETRLRALRGPAAILAMEDVFSSHSRPLANTVVRVLNEMRAPQATDSLVRHAVWSRWPPVRQAAVDALASRDRNRYIPQLIEHLVPVRTVGIMLFARRYMQLGLSDVRTIITGVVEKREQVDRALWALRSTTWQNLGNDPTAWRQWWAGENHVYLAVMDAPEYHYQYAPTVVLEATPVRPGVGMSCFVAGTPIWTRRGLVAIDRIQLGDLVLSMDTATGELDYKPVVVRTVRPRTKLRTLRVHGESIGATLGHPFWVAGKGWIQVKDLQGGDALRAHRGTLKLAAVAEGREDIAFNLEVAEFDTYFVGHSKLLVHDNSPILDPSQDEGIDRALPVSRQRSTAH